jgi:hypothetical protein
MRTLKESILDDIEDTIAKGDKYDNDIKGELKKLQRIVSRVKYWERGYKRDMHYIRLGIPNLLKLMGYDADTIEIVVSYEGIMQGKWRIDIIIVNNPYDNREFLYDSIIYISELTTKYFKDVLKKVLVPAFKDTDSFKKFLEKVESRKNTLNTINNLDDIL